MSSIRILLVEDNFNERFAFEELVQQDRLPYDYAIASSVAEAGSILMQEEEDFDIAILNCQLKDGTAPDLLPTLSDRQIPVILKVRCGNEEALIALMQQNRNVRSYLIEDTDRRYLKLLPVTIEKVLDEVQTQTRLQELQIKGDRDRQMAEEAIQQYQQLLANLQTGIVVHTADTRILIANTRASELLGLTFNQIPGKTASDPAWNFFRSDGSIMPLAEYPVNRVIAAEEAIENYIVGVHRLIDENIIWLMANAYPIFNSSGNIYQVVVTFIDITALKQAEKDLHNLVEGAAAVTGENFFPALAEYISAALGIRYIIVCKSQGDSFQSYAFWADGQLQPNISGSLHNTPCGLTISEGTYFCSHQLQQHFPGNETLVAMSIESYLGIALTNIQGEVIGSLCVLDDKPLTQKQKAISMLRVFAARVSAELERQEAIDALRQLNQDLESRVEQRTAELQEAITELQQVEEQLRNLSDRLTLAIRSGGFGIWEYDINRNANIWDDRMCELYGTRPEDFCHTYAEWIDKLHPDDRAAVNELSQQVLLNNKEYDTEFRVIHPNGEVRFLKAYGIVQWNHLGEPQRIIGVNLDITDRKRIEEALCQSEARNRAILEAIPDLLLRLKRDGSCLDCILPKGSSAESFFPVREHLSEVLTPDLFARQLEAMEQAITTGQLQVYEHQLSKQGQLISHEVRVIALNEEEVLTIVRDITDRKQMEEALRYSEERFKVALKNSPIVVFNQDLDLRYTWIYNPALDYKPEEVIGKFDRDLFLPEYAENLEKIKRTVLANGKSIREEVTIRNRDNIKCYVLAVAPSYDVNNQLEGVTCAALDITQQKQIELALQQQLAKEKLLVSVLQRIRDSLDFQEILNCSVDEVRQIIQADRVLVYQYFPNNFVKVVAESTLEHWEKILNFTFPDEAFSQTYYQSYVRGEIYLINDRDRSPIVDSMMQFMQEFQIRAKLVLPIVQQENEQLWGWLIAHQCSRSRQWELWEIKLLQQLAGQLAVAIDRSNLYSQLQVELNERKQAEAELYEANERLRIVNAELARAARLKDEFLANMSHELRTPLNAILGLSEGLMKEVFGSLNENQKKFISIIDRSGRHLLDLINDILDLAKIEAGKIELEFNPVSLSYLCETCLPFVKQQALKKKIQLDADVPANLEPIEADERRLKQVLINLLSNAVKFTPEGGKVHLEVSTDPRYEMVAIRVIDTGIGIASKDMDKLFKAFSQVDSTLSRQHEGTGLGLALVHRIVSLHGGSVTVESEVDRGSCFTVKLPFHQSIKSSISNLESYAELPSKIKLFQPEVETIKTENDRKNQEETFGDRSEPLITNSFPYKSSDIPEKPLVLLAEDNQINVLMLSEYLKKRGYRVVIVSNGIEAVEKTKLLLPSIVLMDIQMPLMNGLEATRQILANQATAKIPIFALTALAMPDDREKCLEAGVVEYLTKPINLKELLALMKTYINR